MSRAEILIVEDEEEIRELVRYNLERGGYQVAGTDSGDDALTRVRSLKPDLIVLDLMLPGLDGLSVCRILKEDPETRSVPIIMLTARGEEKDIVAGLELGADDYVTKPFSPRILLSRIEAVLRRTRRETQPETEEIRCRELTIHPGRHEVSVNGRPIHLTVTEFRILHLLMRRAGWVFTRSQIVDAVRGEDYPVTERSVDVQIAGLRKKLGLFGEYVETVRGIGYKVRGPE